MFRRVSDTKEYMHQYFSLGNLVPLPVLPPRVGRYFILNFIKNSSYPRTFNVRVKFLDLRDIYNGICLFGSKSLDVE